MRCISNCRVNRRFPHKVAAVAWFPLSRLNGNARCLLAPGSMLYSTTAVDRELSKGWSSLACGERNTRQLQRHAQKNMEIVPSFCLLIFIGHGFAIFCDLIQKAKVSKSSDAFSQSNGEATFVSSGLERSFRWNICFSFSHSRLYLSAQFLFFIFFFLTWKSYICSCSSPKH